MLLVRVKVVEKNRIFEQIAPGFALLELLLDVM